MTKTLESVFGFAPIDETDTESNTQIIEAPVEEERNIARATIDMGNRIDIALPTVTDMATAERELDELAIMAKDQSERLMDLGFNVDDRNAGLIFSVAAQLLNTAVSARVSKLDKKLKMIRLQLHKAKLDADKKEEPESKVLEASDVGVTGNRNDIIKAILNRRAA